MEEKITSPIEWGKLKSNSHYACIDNKIHAIRPTKDFVLYKGRWRPIEKDELGNTYVNVPTMGILCFFEIKEFDK